MASASSAWHERSGLGNGTPGSDLPTLVDVGDAQTTVQSASAGEEHSLVLTDKGKVYAMGDNSNGALGLGSRGTKTPIFEPTPVTFFAPVTEIAAGGKHSLARRKGQTTAGAARRRRARDGRHGECGSPYFSGLFLESP